MNVEAGMTKEPTFFVSEMARAANPSTAANALFLGISHISAM
jgi:hypothetical protein